MSRYALRQTAADTPLARWLVELAERRGWASGRQAAKYLGVNQASFATWLRGEFTPSHESQQRLAERAGETLETIARLAAASRPTGRDSERERTDSPALSPGIMSALASQVAEQTSAAVLRSLSPLFHHLAPTHYTEDEWLDLVRMVVVEVEGVAVEADENGLGGGQPSRGERYVLWEARVSGSCMSPTIPDGCRVLLERRTAIPGETVAVSVGGVVMVKRLAIHKGERVLVTEDGTMVHPDGESRVMGVVCFVPMPRGPTDVR